MSIIAYAGGSFQPVCWEADRQSHLENAVYGPETSIRAFLHRLRTRLWGV